MRITRVLEMFSEIECQEIQKNAVMYDSAIAHIMNKVVGQLNIPVMEQENILKSKNVRIAVRDEDVYEDVYNGEKKPGHKYIISWFYNLTGPEKKPDSFGMETENDLLAVRNVVYFIYECSDYFSGEELKAKKYYNFWIRAKGIGGISNNGTIDKEDSRIGHINENSKPMKVFNPLVATNLVLAVRKIIEKNKLLELMKKELCMEEGWLGLGEWIC